MNDIRKDRLRQLPAVDKILEHIRDDPHFNTMARSLVLRCVRSEIDDLRRKIISDADNVGEAQLHVSAVVARVKAAVQKAGAPKLRPVINATGVVVHTNLGRSLLSPAALAHLALISERYSNLEFDLSRGKRGSRYSLVEELLCEISGAPAAMVVNNNAGAVLLSLDTVARGKNVIVSRGELVEIGGAFRIPDVMAKSGAALREVGTTNRTHPGDYERAVDDNTGLLLKVHTSNYSIVGFTASVSLTELVALGEKYHLPVMEDLGSGTFVDFTQYGLMAEPTVQQSVATGADLITFSGDKLLGGPQAGIILGKKYVIDKIKKNPLTRALRIDKLTLAALEMTLQAYRDESRAVEEIPTLRMITTPLPVIEHRANLIVQRLSDIGNPDLTPVLLDLPSRVGGGALPMLQIPSKCVGVKIRGMSANTIEKRMRKASPPIIGRIENDDYIMDPRTIREDEIDAIGKAFEAIV